VITQKIENGGLPFIHIQNEAAQAKICLLGATVMEYQPRGAAPVLWTSPNSQYAPGSPIRGGIPVCWPWFGQASTPGLPQTAGGLPAHGFVRTRLWTVAHMADETRQRSVVELACADDEATRQLWPYAFGLRLRVTVGAELSVALIATNTGASPFPFSEALHSYFAISDIGNIQIDGLENVPFLSKVHDYARFVEAEPVHIAGQVDRVYLDTESACTIHDPVWSRQIVVEKSGSRTSVVWNAWAKISAEMADLGAEMYRKYVCVETVTGPQEQKVLPAGDTHTMTTHIRLE
jgi:glucose-6-phosphate 1-epimerase